MLVKNLPAKNSKDEPNIIRVTNAKMLQESWPAGTYENGVVAKNAEGSKDGKGVTLEIPAELFAFNQYENVAEFVADCGGDAKVLEIVNDFKRAASTDSGKVTIRTTTNKDVNAVVQASLKSVLEHTFQHTESITGAVAKEKLNELKADAANLSDADLAAKLRAILGGM